MRIELIFMKKKYDKKTKFKVFHIPNLMTSSSLSDVILVY